MGARWRYYQHIIGNTCFKYCLYGYRFKYIRLSFGAGNIYGSRRNDAHSNGYPAITYPMLG